MAPLRLLDTLSLGLAMIAAGIIAEGALYDHMRNSGERVSAMFVAALAIVCGVIATICSVAGIENRKGLRSRWREDM